MRSSDSCKVCLIESSAATEIANGRADEMGKGTTAFRRWKGKLTDGDCHIQKKVAAATEPTRRKKLG